MNDQYQLVIDKRPFTEPQWWSPDIEEGKVENLSLLQRIEACFFSERLCYIIFDDEFKSVVSFILFEKGYEKETVAILRLGYYSGIVSSFLETQKMKGIPFKQDTEMKVHQMTTIAWMRKCEQNPHHGIVGGIVALKQGLGKTLTSCAYMLHHITQFPPLVICDTSLLQNWKDDIEKFFGKKVRVLILHKKFVHVDALEREDLFRYDIVVTSYGSCMNAYKKGKYNTKVEVHTISSVNGKTVLAYLDRAKKQDSDDPKAKGLDLVFKTPWNIVFSDESQKMVNPSTKTFACLLAIYGDVKWCLTGTPHKNVSVDIWSQLRFCGYDKVTNPKDKNNKWTRTKFNDHTLSSRILLMDYKEAGIKLPPRQEIVINLTLTPEEKECYAVILAAAKKVYQDFVNSFGNFSHVLAALTRLRQVCIACYLVRKKDEKKGDSSDEDIEEDVDRKEGEDGKPLDDAPIVNDPIKFDSKMTAWLNDKMGTAGEKSRKTIEILRIIDSIPKDEKILVFSQFTSYLSIAQRAYDKHVKNKEGAEDMKSLLLDGKKTPHERSNILTTFKENKSVKVLFLSYGVGSVGLNLTEANHCICIEPWWNLVALEQAKARIHRIGQNKTVFVYNLIIKDSIESAMIGLCQEKLQESRNFFNGEEKSVDLKLDMKAIGRLLSQA